MTVAAKEATAIPTALRGLSVHALALPLPIQLLANKPKVQWRKDQDFELLSLQQQIRMKFQAFGIGLTTLIYVDIWGVNHWCAHSFK